jgi:CubicO group peptidase (beta-lactamase class C family)
LPPDVPLSPDARKITLLQLATHTSGLPRQPVTLQTLHYFLEYLFDGENFYRHFDEDYMLHYLADFEADHAGEPRYSNIGYGLLGYIVERRTGQTVDALLAQEITGPLGLRCTGYDAEQLPCYANRAHGYAGDQPKFIARGESVPDWHFTHFMRGSAALSSTARDLLTFAAAHIQNQGRPLNATLADDMQVRFPRPKEAAALAWVVDDVQGEPIAYQIGLVAGYTGYLGVDAAHKTAVVILQNSFNWDNSAGHRLLLDLRYRGPDSAQPPLRETP